MLRTIFTMVACLLVSGCVGTIVDLRDVPDIEEAEQDHPAACPDGSVAAEPATPSCACISLATGGCVVVPDAGAP